MRSEELKRKLQFTISYCRFRFFPQTTLFPFYTAIIIPTRRNSTISRVPRIISFTTIYGNRLLFSSFACFFHRQCALFILTSSAILRIRRFTILFLRSRLLTPPPPPSSSASLFPPHFFCFDVFRGVDDGPRMKYICRVTTYTAFNRQRIQDALEMHFGVRFLPARKRSRRALRSVPGSRLFCFVFLL